MNSLETYNPDFPLEAQVEWHDFLDSQRGLRNNLSERRQENLRRLVVQGEGHIVIPRGRINSVRNQLAEFGI